MKSDDAYLYARDIDWFCVIGGVSCHVASAGGLLPDVVNDREKLRDIQKRVFDMDYIFAGEEINLNINFLKQRFGDEQEKIESYIASFVHMSRKGFVSFDRTNVEDLTDQTYHIVCCPKRIVELNDFSLPRVECRLIENGLVDVKKPDFFNSIDYNLSYAFD